MKPSGHPEPSIRAAFVKAYYSATGVTQVMDTATEMTSEGVLGEQGAISSSIRDQFNAYLIGQVNTQGNTLLGKEADLYAAYDRLKAEYEFRIGVTAPLIALILTLAIRWTSLWLLALLPLLLLLKTGSERRMEARCSRRSLPAKAATGNFASQAGIPEGIGASLHKTQYTHGRSRYPEPTGILE